MELLNKQPSQDGKTTRFLQSNVIFTIIIQGCSKEKLRPVHFQTQLTVLDTMPSKLY